MTVFSRILSEQRTAARAQTGSAPLSHNAVEWRKRFDRAIQLKHFSELRPLRCEVQRQTCRVLDECRYRSCESSTVDLTLSAPAASKIWDEVDIGGVATGDVCRTSHCATVVYVEDLDCLRACQLVTQLHPTEKVAVLNMANAFSPGGGWRQGCGAQEENLFRRTTLKASLLEPDGRAVRYPLPEFGGAYSPDVTVFRGTEGEGYPMLSAPFVVSVISVAAYHNPPLQQGRLRGDYAERTRRKIRMIFAIARRNGVRHLVVSAFGCGAFRNPPSHIAELFAGVLGGEEFRGAFGSVVFAIINDHNSPQGGNVAPFRQALPGALCGELQRAVWPAPAAPPASTEDFRGSALPAASDAAASWPRQCGAEGPLARRVEIAIDVGDAGQAKQAPTELAPCDAATFGIDADGQEPEAQRSSPTEAAHLVAAAHACSVMDVDANGQAGCGAGGTPCRLRL